MEYEGDLLNIDTMKGECTKSGIWMVYVLNKKYRDECVKYRILGGCRKYMHDAYHVSIK